MALAFSHDEAKAILIEVLVRDAALHEARHYRELGAGFDEIDARIPRNAGAAFDTILSALDFWAGWLDASAHDWLYYNSIGEDDWPTLARTMVADLRADHGRVEPIKD